MKLLSLIIFLSGLLSFQLQAEEWPLKDTSLFQARNGLPNFFHKMDQKLPTHVGFLGGSITYGDFWRPKVEQWLIDHYQNPQLSMTNVAVAGSNSKYTAFRVDEEVLSKYQFDLLFIEFAVNDAFYASSPDIERSMEAIVRKVRQNNPYTDICFVYTVQSSFLTDIENGKMNLTASKHDSIAAYYGHPSIFWGAEFHRLSQRDSIVFYDASVDLNTSLSADGKYVLTKDQKHPTDYGSQVCADVLAKCFQQMEQNKGIQAHSLPEEIVENNYFTARMELVRDEYNYGYTKIDALGIRNEFDPFIAEGKNYLISEDPSHYYSFSFYGSEMGISFLTGPSAGKFIIEVDGQLYGFQAFDGYSQHWRKQYRFLELPCGQHNVKIYPSSFPLSLTDKENILIAEYRKRDLRDNPDKYDKNELIFSDILLFSGSGRSLIQMPSHYDLCEGDSLDLQSSYPFKSYWSNGDSTRQISIKQSGQYYFRTESGGCVQYSDSVQINFHPIPAIQSFLKTDPSLCDIADGKIVIQSTPGVMLHWTGASNGSLSMTASRDSIQSIGPGTYQLYVANQFCQSDTVQVELVAPPNPEKPLITVSGNLDFCQGDSVLLESSISSDILWSNGASSPSIWVQSTGNYHVRHQLGNCTEYSDTIHLEAHTPPSLLLSNQQNPTGCGDTDGQVELGGTGTGVLHWTGSASGNFSGNLPTTVGQLAKGNYQFWFTNDYCASDTVSVSLSDPGAPPSPVIEIIGSTNLCQGDSVLLRCLDSGQLNWSEGSSGNELTIHTGGQYFVSNTVNGCTSVSEAINVNVTVPPAKPIIQIADSLIFCVGDSLVLSTDLTQNYTWSNGANSSQITLFESDTIFLVQESGPCLSHSDTLIIQAIPLPEKPEIDPDVATVICFGNAIQLKSSSVQELLWSTGEQTSSIHVNEAGWYTLSAHASGCYSEADSVLIEASTLEAVSLGEIGNICDSLEEYLFTNGLPNGGTYYLNGLQTNSILPAEQWGTHELIYVVEDANCSDSDSIHFEVISCSSSSLKENTEIKLKIYPNPGTGTVYYHTEKPLLEFSIYDQSGRLIEQGHLHENHPIELNSQLENGNYLLMLKTTEGTYWYKYMLNR
ncbi:MAG: T9SS type A sorting domain-containing protein [Bacteroidetes bacterium]|nr:MAG: T9SS type A sorting domain-containing protein [Bacteroidota bacterium]